MQSSPAYLCRGRKLNNRETGNAGEDLATLYLKNKGYSLIGRNYRTRFGEIDLILYRDGVLVFVEVKLRRGPGFGGPLEAVTPRKQSTIRLIAEHYLDAKEPDFETVRFDVVGILMQGGEAKIQHIEDAF